jgi:dihydrofolate reductase
MATPQLVLYICMSLDGYIASKDDDISWLSIVDREGEDYGYTEFSESVDNYIVGRKTYDKVMNMVGEFPPAKEFKCYVISRERSGSENGITFYNGDIRQLVDELKRDGRKNIYCDGGGELVHLLMENKLIDQYIISIIPTIRGDGKRLFLGGTQPSDIILRSVKRFESGLVQLHYSTVV